MADCLIYVEKCSAIQKRLSRKLIDLKKFFMSEDVNVKIQINGCIDYAVVNAVNVQSGQERLSFRGQAFPPGGFPYILQTKRHKYNLGVRIHCWRSRQHITLGGSFLVNIAVLTLLRQQQRVDTTALDTSPIIYPSDGSDIPTQNAGFSMSWSL